MRYTCTNLVQSTNVTIDHALPARESPMLHRRPFLGINLEASIEMPSTDMLKRFDGSDSSVINTASSFGLIGIPCPDSCSVENAAFPIDSLAIRDNSSDLSTLRCSRFDTSCAPELVRSFMDLMTT